MRDYRHIIFGLLLILGASLGSYYFYTLERAHQQAVRDVETSARDVESSVLEARQTPESKIELYFYKSGALAPGPAFLAPEERMIYETEDVSLKARQIINEVLKGPQNNSLAQVFPASAKLRQVYLMEDGTAIVDVSRDTAEQLPGGVTMELAALYSITRSLIRNVPEIHQVRFLVDGKQRPTFAGHVSISRPFM